MAEVDGKTLTLADFERQRPGPLFQARDDFYAERKALDAFLDDYLLEREAQKKNTTVADLLERQVNSTIDKDPEDSALYEGLDTAEPFEAVRGKILESLRQRRTAGAKALAFILTNPRFEVVRLKDLAREIGMKAKRFDQRLDTNEGGEAVKAHSEEAIKPGLPGTPGFFLNGRFFSGILTYDPLRQILEEELKRVSGESRAASLQ